MCRFALYLGPEILVSSLVTEPRNSIVKQSFKAKMREEPLNGDGFGIAWYVPQITNLPARFRSVSPAWSNQNLHHLSRVTSSHCVLAHVRAATPGLPVHELNCHPFIYGPFAFMHNGSIGGFLQYRRQMINHMSEEAFRTIDGSTDSEHLFALFIDQWERRAHLPDQDRMAQALEAAVAEVEKLRQAAGIEEPSALNLAVTDGTHTAVCRYISHSPEKANTLFFNEGQLYQGDDGFCHWQPNKGNGPNSLLVASEPLSRDSGWEPVPLNAMLTASTGSAAKLTPLNLPGAQDPA